METQKGWRREPINGDTEGSETGPETKTHILETNADIRSENGNTELNAEDDILNEENRG